MKLALTRTNSATPLYKHEHMRLVARQDHGFVQRERTQRVTIKQEYRIKGSRSMSQRSTGAGEFERDSQLDHNTKRKQKSGQTRGNYHSRGIASKVSENLCQTSTS